MTRSSLVFSSCFFGMLLVLGSLEIPSSLGAQTPVAANTSPDPFSDKSLPPPEIAAPPSCVTSTCREAPVREKLSAINIGQKHVRGIVGGFEQGAGIAGGMELTSADTIHHVELRAFALTSTSIYRRFDLGAAIPTIGSDRNHGEIWFGYSRRDTGFLGIGQQSPLNPKAHFALEERSYQGTLTRDVATHLQAGIFSQVASSHATNGKTNGDTPIDQLFSSTPDTPPLDWVPGLLSTAKILSYGSFIEYDARDNNHGLTRGTNLYVRLASRDGLKNHDAFADYGWVEGEFDARAYIPVGGARTSLALRSRGEFMNPKGGSQIPFYDLAWLGGREYLRGYANYRFRGNNVLLFSTELRRTVYRQTTVRGVDVFGFADSGQVWGDNRSLTDLLMIPSKTFSSSNWRTGVGGGLQYRRSRNLGGRIEVGHGNEGSVVYASMSRGF
jgi:hypothetical protein